MGIPTIHPYPMPAAGDLVASAATWRPDRRRAALLIHDMQRYFVDFLPAGQAPTTDLIANVARLRRAAARHGLPVIYTAQPGPMTRHQRGLLADIWGPGMNGDPQGLQIVAGLAPRPDDRVVYKRRYSAFHGTDLAATLAQAHRDQLIVCGLYAQVGCLVTSCDAFSHDIETFLVADAIAGFSRREHLLALEAAGRLCAVTLTTDRLLAQLRAVTGAGVGVSRWDVADAPA